MALSIGPYTFPRVDYYAEGDILRVGTNDPELSGREVAYGEIWLFPDHDSDEPSGFELWTFASELTAAR